VSLRWLFSGVALLAILAGLALWLGNEPGPRMGSPDLAPEALYAASFRDPAGAAQSLARYQGQIVVLNFWATWCAPCRQEMPGFQRLSGRWSGRGVQFVGIADDEPGKVSRFAHDLGIGYPLWVGGAEVDELARRLGDVDRLLPFTVVLGPQGQVLQQKVGVYSEVELNGVLEKAVAIPPVK
jgi:thiol-disulfide isomerase/thioredoxin